MNQIPTFKFALVERVINSPLNKNDVSFIPTRAEPHASGWDCRAALESEKLVIQPYQYVRIPLGFRSFCPEGWWYEIRPRSSTFAKKHLHALYGVIDCHYESELVAAMQYIPSYGCENDTLTIEYGEAIAQIIPIQRQEMQVSLVSNEEYDRLCQLRGGVRGTGGFGSTSK